jgi:hypothetical protein
MPKGRLLMLLLLLLLPLLVLMLRPLWVGEAGGLVGWGRKA